jgi:threonine dehydrogenase-like Zn-dependent dehydrogenase
MQNGAIKVESVPDPAPGEGQLLVRTLRCGVCASDLHVLHHGGHLVEWSREHGAPFTMDLARPVVLGHEYCAEIVDYGPGTKREFPIGTIVTSTPAVIHGRGVSAIGLSNEFPGGFGELMVLSELFTRAVPDSLGPDLAALTEPVSVGIFYVRAARLADDDVPLVIGAGAIGLAVVAALHRAGARPIVVADYSPVRRELATQMGADVVIDASKESPYKPSGTDGRQPTVIFECVGVPGVLDGIIHGAAHGARVIVAGWCLEIDHLFTAAAHYKGLTLQFGGGPMPEDFDTALRALGDGDIEVSSWVTDSVGLSGVAEALEAMRDPDRGIRTVVVPSQP